MGDEREPTPEPAAMGLFDDETADETIRRVWHEDRWFFSVVDVIAALTESKTPNQYWRDMKRRIQDEGFSELINQCQQVKITAADGKLRETDCADFIIIAALIQYLPILYRREPSIYGMWRDRCGVYSIRNDVTQDEYIGSSRTIAQRFTQHRALLCRGRHHAGRLQDAWNTYGEDAFSLIILEEVADPARLTTAERKYFDERHPIYNESRVATNLASYELVPPSRIQQTLRLLYRVNGGQEESALFRAVEPALAYGVFAPGPRFALLLQAASGGVGTWEDLGHYLRQQGLE